MHAAHSTGRQPRQHWSLSIVLIVTTKICTAQAPCTTEGAELSARAFLASQYRPKGTQREASESACPDPRWLDDFAEPRTRANSSQVIVIVVGCNKGYDAVQQLRLWTRNTLYSKVAWKRYWGSDCGVCQQCETEEAPASLSGQDAALPAVVHCIEPLPANYRTLQRAQSELRYSELKVVQLALSNESGSVDMASRTRPGLEHLGIGSVFRGDEQRESVAVSTLDAYAGGFDRIDVLSIDVEGFDPLVLQGGDGLLRRGSVRYLEFEVNAAGRWRTTRLKDVIRFLDRRDYECFFEGKGRVWPLSGSCWHWRYDHWTAWSNVVCVRRGDEWLATLATFVVNAQPGYRPHKPRAYKPPGRRSSGSKEGEGETR